MTTGRDGAAGRLWIKLDLGGRGQIGPGKIRLLQAIDEHRSISGAARATGMSYRRAWLLIDALNTTCGQAVVETHVGGPGRGGAALTDLGRDLVAAFEAIAAASQRASRRRLDALLSRLDGEFSGS